MTFGEDQRLCQSWPPVTSGGQCPYSTAHSTQYRACTVQTRGSDQGSPLLVINSSLAPECSVPSGGQSPDSGGGAMTPASEPGTTPTPGHCYYDHTQSSHLWVSDQLYDMGTTQVIDKAQCIMVRNTFPFALESLLCDAWHHKHEQIIDLRLVIVGPKNWALLRLSLLGWSHLGTIWSDCSLTWHDFINLMILISINILEAGDVSSWAVTKQNSSDLKMVAAFAGQNLARK